MILNTAFDTWICSINPIEIFIAGVLGIITGLLASWLYSYRIIAQKRKKLDEKFKPIEGTFIRWFKEDKDKGDNRIIAKAVLTHYPGENRLKIRVTTLIDKSTGKDFKKDRIQEWTGEIIMDTIKSGTIVFEQIEPKKGKNGFKRIIVENDKNGITLVGEKDEGFGIERFTERENNSPNQPAHPASKQ